MGALNKTLLAFASLSLWGPAHGGTESTDTNLPAACQTFVNKHHKKYLYIIFTDGFNPSNTEGPVGKFQKLEVFNFGPPNKPQYVPKLHKEPIEGLPKECNTKEAANILWYYPGLNIIAVKPEKEAKALSTDSLAYMGSFFEVLE